MHNYFLGGRGSSLSATTPDSRLRAWHRAPIDIFHFLGQSDAQMTYGEWTVNFIETNKPCLLLFPCLPYSVALSTIQCHVFQFIYCLSSPLEWRSHLGRDLVCAMHRCSLGPRTMPGTLQALNKSLSGAWVSAERVLNNLGRLTASLVHQFSVCDGRDQMRSTVFKV